LSFSARLISNIIPDMKKHVMGGKDVYIVENHNEVIEAWEKHQGLNVFSLDYHTDTRQAFHNFTYWKVKRETEAGICSNQEERIRELTEQKIDLYLNKELSAEQINYDLKHDEHLDFATRTQIINMAFVLSVNSNKTSSNPNVHIVQNHTEYKNQRLLEYSIPCIPGCLKDIHDENCRAVKADSALEDIVLKDAMAKAESYNPGFFDNFILDIDCDYLNTDKSLYPEAESIFHRLISKSHIISIAMEPACVRICRHKNSRLDSDIIIERLLSAIETALIEISPFHFLS